MLMTEKARALGMANTTYVNASGLPAEEQITTARDQAILGRAIQDRFPIYYRYFSTPSFRYRGARSTITMACWGTSKGVDGIKTGYTEASGYNLVTSVRRDDKHIVAVVLGGKSNAARDARMRELIEELHRQSARASPGSGRWQPSGSAAPTLRQHRARSRLTQKRRSRRSEPQTEPQAEAAKPRPRTAKATAAARLPLPPTRAQSPVAQRWWRPGRAKLS